MEREVGFAADIRFNEEKNEFPFLETKDFRNNFQGANSKATKLKSRKNLEFGSCTEEFEFQE